MPYANATTKRTQVLEALRASLATIATPDFATDVKRVWVYSGHRLQMGGEMPAIAVLPTEENRTKSLACASDEYSMGIEIVGASRVTTDTDGWQASIESLVGDIQQLLNNDRQLGGSVVYIEANGAVVSDALTTGAGALAVASVPCTLVYRVSVADVTA